MRGNTLLLATLTDGVVIVGSFLLSFKAVLLEGSEVAILSVATVKQLGKSNVLLGVVRGTTSRRNHSERR